jgi:long-chain acyl-CoA synthetase
MTNKFPTMSLAEAHALLTRRGSPFEMEERDIRGVRTRVWKNAPPTMRDLFRLARSHGNKTFVVYRDERVSYDEFARAALAIAEALQRAGVKKGDRVAIAMRNLPEWPAAFFGCLLAGGIAVLLNAWWTGPELQYGLNDSGAKVAIVDHERLGRLFEHLQNCPALERVFVSRETEDVAHPQVTKLETIIGEVSEWHLLPDRPLPDVPLDPEDDATILYTSGTTGKPKGAIGTHRNSTTAVLVRPFGQARTFLRRGEPVPPPDPNAPQKCSLLVVPLFHTTGCHAAMVPSLAAGVKLVFMHKWDPELAMQLIERERINNAGGVPTIAWQLLEHPAFGRYDLSSLESISYGGAPAAAELVARLKEKFPRVVPGYRLGHDRSVRRLHRTSGRGLRASPGELRARIPDRRDEDRGCHGQRSSDRRGRRALGQRPKRGQRLLAKSASHRGDLHRRLAPHRRHRPPRR